MTRPTNAYEHWMYGDERDTMKKEEPRYLGRRVSNEGPSVSAWSEQTGNGSSWYDLCKSHAEQLDRDSHHFDEYLKPWNGDPPGEDGWGGDCAHPNYDDDEYRCAIPDCKVLLGG